MKSHKLKYTQKKQTLEDVFQDINRKCVRLQKEDRKKSNAILYSILREILILMRKSDPFFNDMKPQLEYLGSYYDGLRVGQPTEYDINVILKLPVNYANIYLDATHVESYDQTRIFLPAEFVRVTTIPYDPTLGYYKGARWCDDHFRLSVNRFRSWMQGVLDQAIEDLPVQNGRRAICVNNTLYAVSTKMSGPAHTIMIQTGVNVNDIIDVDLVPTLSFKLPTKPVGSKIFFEAVENTKLKQYFLVPKPSHDEFGWRLAFPFQERYYMKDKNNLKAAVKLIKLLRDTQGFKQLASYYIKTIFLWEVRLQPESFWKDNSLSFLVLHMIKKLRDSLSQGEIKSFWCADFNIIEGKIKTDTCKNWSNRLAAIIKDIEEKGKNNPCILWTHFTTMSEEL